VDAPLRGKENAKMEPKLVALKVTLDELGVSESIETVDDRKRVQKAIYLGQLAGVPLGYRFGWYLKGPYSPDLTKDYYNLAEAIAIGEDEYKGKVLLPALRGRLQRIKPLLIVPENVPLPVEDWLELVSSVHYLRQISKYDENRADEVLESEKPLLAPYKEYAQKALRGVELID
jgi:uncharacterized protein YwgA